jgi:hypothetical protein
MGLFILVFGYIVYMSIILLQGGWYRSRSLTKNKFVLPQVAYWSIFPLVAFLVVSTTREGVFVSLAISLVCGVISYILTKWIYRKLFQSE